MGFRSWLMGTAMWRSIEEPRLVTVVMVTMYAAALLASAALIRTPAPTPIPHTSWIFTWVGAVFFGIGGLLGMPTAWTGKWWVERVAAGACLGGSIVMLFEVGVLLHPAEPNLLAPALTLPGSVFSVGLFLTRFFRVRSQPYAPGKGPVLPKVQATELVNQMVAEDLHQRRQH